MDDTEEANKILDRLKAHKELWFIVPILMYVVSFVLEFIYYQHFDINIVNYISPLGLIFSFASLFVGFFIIGVIHLAASFFVKFAFSESRHKDISLKAIMFAINILIFEAEKVFNFSVFTVEIIHSYEITFMMIWAIYSFEYIQKSIYYKIAAVFVIVISFVQNHNGGRMHYSEFGYLNAISFNYNGLFVHSNGSDKVYIGETSDFIFLYNRPKKETTIYKKSNIDSLVIKSPPVHIEKGKHVFEQYETKELMRKAKMKQLTRDDSTFLKSIGVLPLKKKKIKQVN